jgi:predicted nucleic acid-binding protein
MTTFVDTSGLYAVLDRDDRCHSRAIGAWADLLAEHELLVSNYVLVETLALVQNRLGVEAVRAVVQDVVPVLQIHWVDAEDHARAVDGLLTANRRDLSLVDCMSFHIMRRHDIQTAFAFDGHFEEQGFTTLPATA